ncbi:hypothetical protein RugamoR64_39690 [Duganella rhizosphaerae]|uniref:hypothetical protein n=1 Tax=Duganella rhizosphaerae TaxID=2885763 RepID=UPI0030E8BD7F
MNTPEQHYILVLVNVVTKTSIGVEFCKDLEDLMWKRGMFLNDFGRDDHVALTYPDSGAQYADALAEVAGAVPRYA